MATNQERTEATRSALINSASDLFATQGFSATGTPQLTKRAGVSRGALYHHFDDKADLLRAVIEYHLTQLAETIDTNPRLKDPINDMISAGEAYLDALAVEGRYRLLYVEGPAVLGFEKMKEIDEELGVRTLRQGLRRAVADGAIREVDVDVDSLADLLSAAYEEAARHGTPRHRRALRAVLEGLRKQPPDDRSTEPEAATGPEM